MPRYPFISIVVVKPMCHLKNQSFFTTNSNQIDAAAWQIDRQSYFQIYNIYAILWISMYYNTKYHNSY